MAFSVNATAAAALLLATSIISLGAGAQSMQMPSDAELKKLMGEQSAARTATLGGKIDPVKAGTFKTTVPVINAPPPTKTETLDDVVARYNNAKNESKGKPGQSDFIIFVSFSMPKEALERIVAQSEKSGAVLVLRGLKGNSLSRMGEELAALVGKRNVTAIIHPPAFKQFKVAQVPALVITRSGQATKIGEDGCAAPASYIKVDGDVGQDYALDLIERQAPNWAEAARRYAARLAGARP